MAANHPTRSQATQHTGVGVAIGAGVGTTIGVLIGGAAIALGLGLGAGVGVAIGAVSMHGGATSRSRTVATAAIEFFLGPERAGYRERGPFLVAAEEAADASTIDAASR